MTHYIIQIMILRCLYNCPSRYGFLLLEDVQFQDPLSVSVAILQQFNILPEMYQVGYTKLFFRTGQVIHSYSSLLFVFLFHGCPNMGAKN